MIFWVIRIAIIYIILIFLIENLFDFFKFRLTAPKIKDLVKTSEMYENIYKKINNEKNEQNNNLTKLDYTLINLLPKQKEENDTMKIELKDFLQKQII
jgi:hypothetical protein